MLQDRQVLFPQAQPGDPLQQAGCRGMLAQVSLGLRVQPARGRQEFVQVQAQPRADLLQEPVSRSPSAVLDIAEVRGADSKLRCQRAQADSGSLSCLLDAVSRDCGAACGVPPGPSSHRTSPGSARAPVSDARVFPPKASWRSATYRRSSEQVFG